MATISNSNGSDPMVVFEGVNLLEQADAKVIYVEPTSKYVVVCPSTYAMRSLPLLTFPVKQTFAKWLYSPDSIVSRYIQMTSQFKKANNPYEQGTYAGIAVENLKYKNIFVGGGTCIAPMYGQNGSVDPTTIYTGRFESTTTNVKADSHILRPFISTPAVTATVNPDEAMDITIRVGSTLSEQCVIAVPVSSPLLGNNTVYGEVGTDSSLPAGACVGVVSVVGDAVLTGGTNGAWLLDDAENALLQNTDVLIASRNVVGSTSGPIPSPSDREHPVAALVQELITSGRSYYALGYKRSIRTVGTGVFAYGTASYGTRVGVIPWGQAMSQGFGRTDLYSNAKSTKYTPVKPTVAMKTLLSMESFIDDIAGSVNRGNLTDVETGSWLPVCSPEIQLTVDTNGAGGCVPVTAGGVLQASHPVLNTSVKVTPVFVPQAINNCKSHFSALWSSAEMVERYYSSPVSTFELPLTLTMPSTADFRQGIPSPSRYVGSFQQGGLDNIKEYARKAFGLCYTSVGHTYIPSSGADPVQAWWITVKWTASDPDITVGQQDAYIPLVSVMTNMLIGVLPAGTQAGTYKFKPFARHTVIPGSIELSKPYEDVPAVTHIMSDKNNLPLLGTNVVNINRLKTDWSTQTVTAPTHLTMVQPIVKGELNSARTSVQQVETIVTIEQESVSLLGYQHSALPEVQARYVAGVDFNDRTKLLVSSPYFSTQYNTTVVGVLDWHSHKLYIITVETDEKIRYVTKFENLVKSYDYANLPCGTLHRVFGFTIIEDIIYTTGQKILTALISGQLDDATSQANPNKSNMVFLGLRAVDDADMVNDILCHLPVYNPYQGVDPTSSAGEPQDGGQFPLPQDVEWPGGLAVQYPYVYVPGYAWYTSDGPSALRGSDSAWKKFEGWSMVLYRVDLLSGAPVEFLQLGDPAMLATTKAIPASFRDYQYLLAREFDTFGKNMAYATTLPNEQFCSRNLPTVGPASAPTLAGFVGVSGLIVAFHNGLGVPVVVNPLSGFVETKGSSVYPFSGLFNGNATSSREFLGIGFPFMAGSAVGYHPFLHVSSGDGSSPADFTSGIDLQDVSKGQTVIRRCRIRNNLVRDQLTNIKIQIPDDSEQPYSSLLKVGLTKDGPWYSEITLLKDVTLPSSLENTLILDPNKSGVFYLRGNPLTVPDSELDPIELYVNAEYDRKTVLFGYKLETPEGL